MTVARYLKTTGLVSFNAREVRRNIGGSLRDAVAMDSACRTLAEAGLIRPCFTRFGETPGRAARNYELNPVVYGGHS
jgi:hypothetical protein